RYNAKQLYKDCLRLHAKWESVSGVEAGKKDELKGKPELTAAQCCLVIHYFLHAAGHNNKGKAIERLIVALTGYGEDSVRKRLADMLSRKAQTSKDLRILKPHFENLGLSKIVELIEVELADRTEDDEDDDLF